MGLKEQYKEEFLDQFGNRVFAYLKFTGCEAWGNDVVNGNLYMNPIKYYRDLEVNSGIKGQGDSGELKLISDNVELKVIIPGTGDEVLLNPKQIKFEYTQDEQIPVFCVMGIKYKDLIVYDYDEETIKFKFPYSKEEIEQLKKDFGEYVVLVFPVGFKAAVQKAANNQNIQVYFGEVHYCDANSEERHDAFFNSDVQRFLYKDLDFSYQKEFRLILNQAITDGNFFEVGSLSDCAQLFLVDDLLNGLLIAEYQFEEKD